MQLIKFCPGFLIQNHGVWFDCSTLNLRYQKVLLITKINNSCEKKIEAIFDLKLYIFVGAR